MHVGHIAALKGWAEEGSLRVHRTTNNDKNKKLIQFCLSTRFKHHSVHQRSVLDQVLIMIDVGAGVNWAQLVPCILVLAASWWLRRVKKGQTSRGVHHAGVGKKLASGQPPKEHLQPPKSFIGRGHKCLHASTMAVQKVKGQTETKTM